MAFFLSTEPALAGWSWSGQLNPGESETTGLAAAKLLEKTVATG